MIGSARQHAPIDTRGARTHYRPHFMATQAGSSSPMRSAVLAAAAFMLFPAASESVTLDGRITFPGRALPAATVYARNVESSQLHKTSLGRNEAAFRFELPAGKYWVFVQPREPGLTELYGAHTRWSVCRRHPTHLVDACNDHGLQEVDLTGARPSAPLEVDDWFLDDAAAETLDGVLGTAAPATPDQSELGRPRFSEYRATAPATLLADPKLDLRAGSKAAPFARELGEAARQGVNFASAFSLARLRCGEACERVALVDLTNGTVLFPEALAQTSTTLPCRAQDVLGYRDDSRLLEFTRRDEESVVTDYLLWDAVRRDFTLLAQYRRNVERFCASPSRNEREAVRSD
jgi:hypothetical protein